MYSTNSRSVQQRVRYKLDSVFREKRQASGRTAHKRYPEQARKRRVRFHKNNPGYFNKASRKYKKANRLQANSLTRRNTYTLKAEMIKAYGGYCYCCKEIEHAFLSIDHTDSALRKKHTRLGLHGGSLYRVLRRAGWPKKGLWLACMNCQFGTRYGKTCPHKER